MKLTWKLIEKSKSNKMFVNVKFIGGDADYEYIHEYILPYNLNNWGNHKKEIEEKITFFKNVQKCLDKYDRDGYAPSIYDEMKDEFGEDVAVFINGNVPSDPTTDFQFYCVIDDISIIAYDNEGNKYKSYIQ
jgi:hypothetical protein